MSRKNKREANKNKTAPADANAKQSRQRGRRRGQGKGRSQQPTSGSVQNRSRRRPVVSNRLGFYAAQMVNPAKEGAVHVLPDFGHTPVCARRYTRTVSVSQAQYPKLRIAMFPNLYAPGYIASQTVVNVPPAATGMVSLSGKLKASADGPGNTTGFFAIKDIIGNHISAAMTDLTDAANVTRKGFAGTYVSGSTMTYVVRNNSGSKIASPLIDFVFATNAPAAPAGAWVSAGGPSQIPEGKDLTGSITIPAGGPFTKFAMTVNGTNSKDVELDLTVNASNAQVTTAAGKTFAPSFAEQIIDEKITHGRVTHMSIFVQNTTAEIAANGSIVAARVPSNFDLSANEGDWMKTASLLPPNRHYIGPMKTGAYTFWMPEQLDEFQIDNISQKLEAYKDANYLIVEIPDWTAGATAEVTFTWIAEFYTSNQNFEKQFPPPLTNDFELAWHLISAFPAAMCNPEHDKETRSYVQKIKSAALHLYNFYSQNKAAIDSVAMAAAEALA